MEITCCHQGSEVGKVIDGLTWVDESYGWCLPGCCGGGCYVMTNMVFCPFCGQALPVPENTEAIRAG